MGGGTTINVYGDTYGWEDFVEKVGEAGVFLGTQGLGAEAAS